jgi:type VI secretion system protein ImpI
MLENFDPQKLEEDLERQSKRGGLLNLGGKGRFRDYYVELFASMTKDPDESFKRLFGESFAQAYEEQMDRLKATERMLGE